MEIVHTIGLTGANTELITKKCPLVFLSLFVLITGIMGITQELFLCGLRLSENIVMCIAISYHYATIMVTLVHSMYNYREIHIIWCIIYEMHRFALKELSHKICFRPFWKRYLANCAIILIVFSLCGALRFSYLSPRIVLRSQIAVVSLQSVVLYIKLHALFIVHLFNYFVKLFIKYICVDHRQRMHNSTGDHIVPPIIFQLRLYQQFHYKLWRMVEAINRFFSFTILILSYHAFADIAYSSYYIFLYIVRDDAPALLIRKPFINRATRWF